MDAAVHRRTEKAGATRLMPSGSDCGRVMRSFAGVMISKRLTPIKDVKAQQSGQQGNPGNEQVVDPAPAVASRSRLMAVSNG